MARPGNFRKQGGGFLNNVDGVIAGYRFTDEFNGVAFEPGFKPGTRDEKFHSLFVEISVRVDGADEDITQNLFAGNADMFDISEDGFTATPTDEAGEDYALGQGTPFHKFLVSLCENGFPEASLPEIENNYEAIIGTRVRFAQQVVTDAAGKPKKRIAKKGKFKGKEFDDTTTVIAQVYELPGKKGKTTPVSGKKTKAVEPEPDEDASGDDDADPVETLAKATLIKVVKANKGKMAKDKLSMAILTAMQKHPQREAVRKLVNKDAFLNTEDGWSYDEDSEVIKVK